jgi:hypothetical protein
MKRSASMHAFVALAALLAWLAAIVTVILNRRDSWALVPVLFGSLATIVGTLLVCRFWIRRKRTPSYGTLFGIPLGCACLVWVGPLFWEACRYGAWYLFTPGYWQQAKGGFTGLYFPIVLIGATSALAAAAIVVFYQGSLKKDAPHAA